jgi:hypothetical protein
MDAPGQTVVVLGASADPSRYAFRAHRLLKEKGHRVIPVSAKAQTIDGDEARVSLDAVPTPVDTVTVYLRPTFSAAYRDGLLALAPRRVIFNPGAENSALASALRAAGIECLEECTLVMLRTGRF